MFSDDRLETDISEIKNPDPKYIDPKEFIKAGVPFETRLDSLEDLVFLRPGDPWVTVGDRLVRLPHAPVGKGLSMNVCARPLLELLGGYIYRNEKTETWEACRYEKSEDIPQGTENISLTVAEIVIPLDLGILINSNGSVYIGKREQLEAVGPPALDDDYILILRPYRDEELFVSRNIIDEWGKKRPEYIPELAIRSLAISKASYNMRIKPFIMDGWLDYCLIHEGEIKATEADWNLEPSSAKVFLSSVKQLISSSSAKAVVMGRPTSDGKAVINITFTGTKHTADWLNNIKVSVSNKLHKGFYELTKQFDQIIGGIHFDRLASTLGLKDLTISDIIKEASKRDSRYKLWITGHSQGGALTQIYVSEFLIRKGVLPENIFAYTFASPLVATAEYCEDPEIFPIYNIVSADDFACRVGSSLRLGIDLVYFPDDMFREKNYDNYSDPVTKAKFKDILKLCYWMTDSFKFGEYMIAMTTFASEYKLGRNIIEWIEGTPILKRMYAAFKSRTNIPEAIHDIMYKLLEKPYMEVGGKPPSEERINMVREFLSVLYQKWGTECIIDYMYATHQIPSNYSDIVLLPSDKLIRAVWHPGRPSELLTVTGRDLMEPVEFPEIESAIDPSLLSPG